MINNQPISSTHDLDVEPGNKLFSFGLYKKIKFMNIECLGILSFGFYILLFIAYEGVLINNNNKEEFFMKQHFRCGEFRRVLHVHIYTKRRTSVKVTDSFLTPFHTHIAYSLS